MKSLAGSFLLACLLVLSAVSSSSGMPAEEKEAVYLPVYLSEGNAGGPISFAASASSFELKVLSSSPMGQARPLLVLVDPSFYSPAELQRRIAAVTEAIAAELPKHPQLRVRMGILALEGMLFDPPAGARAFSAEFPAAVTKVIVEAAAAQESDPGRVLELAAGLLQKADADGGPVDCLLLGKDRAFGQEDAAYLALSAERRVLELCGRKGSVLHGYIEGGGALGSICASTGGMVFSAAEQAGSVVRQVLGARDQGYLVAVQRGLSGPGGGRFDLALRAQDQLGNRFQARAPRALWRNADGFPAPDYGLVRDALDWVRRSQATAKSGDFGTALLWIDNAVQLDPWNPDAFYFGARYTSETGDLSRAAGYISKAMRLGPIAERVLLLYGEVLQKLGKSAQALETIRSLPPGNVPESSQFRLMLARLLAAAGRGADAAVLYAALIDAGFEGSQVRAEYGCVLWHLGKEREAGDRIRSVLAADSQNVTAMICAAEMAGVQGRVREALDFGSRAAVIQPENTDVHLQSGKIQARAHQWESALVSLQTAARLAPARLDILLQLAEAEVQSGQGQTALQTMNRLLAINPSDESAWQEIARIYTRAGQFADAASILEQSAARFPDKASGFYQEAAALREREGEYGQALLDYRTVLHSAAPDRAAQLRRQYSSHTAYLTLMVKGVAERYGGALPPAPGAPASNAADGIIVPGGLSLLANIVGVVPSALKKPDAAGRVFSAVLESIRPEEKKKFSALQSDIAQFYQEYEKLLRRMERQGQTSLQSRGTRQEFIYPLVGDKAGIANAKRFLSFFGVKFSQAQSGGRNTIVFTVSQDAEMQQRQRLLRYMGIDVQDRKLRELRFTLGDERLPSILDARTLLDKILGLQGVKPEALLSKLILRPDAMKLYAALEDCPAPLRTALAGMFSSRELAGMTDLLGNFGRFLEFREGRLVLPGAEKGWEDLVGASCSNPGNFFRAFLEHDKGRLLCTYYALESVSPAVQRYFTASSGRLDELSMLITPRGSGRAVTGGIHWEPEAVRIIRMLSADGQGLFLPLDRRLGLYLLPGRSRPERAPAGEAFLPLRLSEKDLAGLARQSGNPNPSSPRAGAGMLELLKYIQEVRPGLFTDDVIEEFMKSPAESAVYLDLIWDLDPPADVLIKYFSYCRRLAQAGDTGWNISRTRTSQAIFFLVSGIRREGVISRDAAWRLLQAALAGFDAQDEPAFLLNLSEFLTDVLLPELGRSMGSSGASPGLLLEALAGREEPRTFVFEGTPLLLDGPTEQLQRMKSALRPQHFTPLPELLDMIQLAQRIRLGREVPADMLRTLAGKLKTIPAAESAAEASGRKGRIPTQADNGDPAGELESLATAGGVTSQRIAGLMTRISGVLHAELGTALLAHCYAYHGSSQASALTYDPDFIRRHDLYPRGRPSAAAWPAAKLQHGKDGGSRMTGSLSGLGIQLHQLEVQASAQSFGRGDWNGLVPAMLSATRMVPRTLRSDRAQEYVALSAGLGRELLALCVSDALSDQWCAPRISRLLSPLRRERLESLLSRGSFSDAVVVLSPSELFLLGQAYLIGIKVLPARACGRLAPFLQFEGAGCAGDVLKTPALMSPALDRLREIVPGEGSPALDAFLKEVEQYGPFMWRRIGLTENSLRFCDTYELLQNFTPLDLLFERIFDLKIRVAEIGYSASLPASIGGMLEQQALQNLITDPASPRIDSWDGVIEQIGRLGPGNSRGWVEELLNQRMLSIYSGKPNDKPEKL